MVLFGSFWPSYTAKIHARSAALTPFQTVSLRSSRKFALRVGLLLYHRFGCLSGGYGVRVSVHGLPHTVFRSKDHRRAHSVWGDLLTCTYLSLCPLYPHDVGKLRSHNLRYDLVSDELALAA